MRLCCGETAWTQVAVPCAARDLVQQTTGDGGLFHVRGAMTNSLSFSCVNRLGPAIGTPNCEENESLTGMRYICRLSRDHGWSRQKALGITLVSRDCSVPK